MVRTRQCTKCGMKAKGHDGPMGSGCKNDAGHEHNWGWDGAGQRNFGSELAAMTPEQLVALATNQQKAIASLATAARQSPGSGSRATMMSAVVMFAAVGAIFSVLGVGVYMTPQHYKEVVLNDILNMINFTAVTEALIRPVTPKGSNFINGNTGKNKFKKITTDITEGEKYLNFKGTHMCEVNEEIEPDKFDEIIQNIVENIELSKPLIEKMKLSKYKKKTSYSITQFDHGSNGSYRYGRYEAEMSKNKKIDFVLALYKVTWTTPSDKRITSSYQDLLAEWSELHDGTNHMLLEQRENELKKSLQLFIEGIQKKDRDDAATMGESTKLEKHLRQLADQKIKDECKPELLHRDI